MDLSDPHGRDCIDLYQLPTANTTATLFDQTLMASARVIADDVTVDEAGELAQIAGRLLLTGRRIPGRHTLIEPILLR
ncbi:hypothetical protein ACOJBM_02520 [Rhizobium beringeri]